MTGKVARPDGWGLRTPAWHLEKITEFTALKRLVGEPSPHLAIVGHIVRAQTRRDGLWLLGLYAATYSLPTAMAVQQQMPRPAAGDRPAVEAWLRVHWAGIVTRTERRCVRTAPKMADCLVSCSEWLDGVYPKLVTLAGGETRENYDLVWGEASRIRYFGRYIIIRFVEGLRRYFGVPARLYDIRSIGGWSPKRCLSYLYPDEADVLLTEGRAGDEAADRLANHLLSVMRERLPWLDEYILAAMLCEYKGAFEKRHQYPGWTIDQEPLLVDKVRAYWCSRVDFSALWSARAVLFPPESLAEVGGWGGTRWPLAKTLRDHGYNWSDVSMDYSATEAGGNWEEPVERIGA